MDNRITQLMPEVLLSVLCWGIWMGSVPKVMIEIINSKRATQRQKQWAPAFSGHGWLSTEKAAFSSCCVWLFFSFSYLVCFSFPTYFHLILLFCGLCVPSSLSLSLTHTHTHARARTWTHAHTQIHTHTHTHTVTTSVPVHSTSFFSPVLFQHKVTSDEQWISLFLWFHELCFALVWLPHLTSR